MTTSNPATGSSAVRRWELVAGGSAKFWEISQDGATVTVHFGRLNTAGQTKSKDLASAEEAAAHVTKLVAEKEKKGYRPTAAAPAHPAAAVAPGIERPTTEQPAAAPTTEPSPAPAPTHPATAVAPGIKRPTTERPAAVPTTEPSSAAPQPATRTASSIPPATSAPTLEPPVPDEDTWVMPKAWQRNVVRQRGVTPHPVFTIDTEQAVRCAHRPARAAPRRGKGRSAKAIRNRGCVRRS